MEEELEVDEAAGALSASSSSSLEVTSRLLVLLRVPYECDGGGAAVVVDAAPPVAARSLLTHCRHLTLGGVLRNESCCRRPPKIT